MFLTAHILGLIVASLFVVAGLAVAATALPLLISLGVLAALAALCIRHEVPPLIPAFSRCSRVGLAVGAAGGVVAVVYTAIGMTVVLGGATTAMTAVVALAVLGYRYTRRATLRDADPVGDRDADPGDVARTASGNADADIRLRRLLPADPAALSTAELCHAWRVSYLLLQGPRIPELIDDAAERRRRYLDELADRHPEGFRRWLDDGARAAGDPSPYVDPPDRLDQGEDRAS